MAFSRRTTGRRLGWAILLLALLAQDGRAQTVTTQVLSFPSTADTYVDAGATGNNFNGSSVLLTGASPARISYLRFNVTGVGGRAVQQARLRLGVARANTQGGGSVHVIGNGTWSESTTTWTTRPAVDGPALATLGPVPTVGAVVEFVLDGAIRDDGVVNLAIDSSVGPSAGYVSAAASSGQKPTLVLTVASTPNPIVRVVQPADGAAFFEGDKVTLQGTATDPTDGDLGAALTWRSSLQAFLGTGATVTAPLARGSHAITASVTDSKGLAGSARVNVTVSPRPPANTAPLVAITAPLDGATLFAEQPITFTGTANDLEDGVLTPRLSWSSDRDGSLGTGGTVAHTLSVGTHKITARVTDAAGLQGRTSVTVTTVPPGTLQFTAQADAYVDAAAPQSNFGTSSTLRVYAGGSRRAFLRFAVSGVGGQQVTRAVLQMQADSSSSAASNSGGSLYLAAGAWQESTVTSNTAPLIGSGPLATTGAVTTNQQVTFDLTGIIDGDGTYDFALSSESLDEVIYRSRESKTPPVLMLTVTGHPPVVAITAPPAGSVLFASTPVTLAATATDAEDGNVNASLRWTSSLDGTLGSGPQVTRTLKVGTHVVTASATDADGRSGQAQTTLRVRGPNAAPKITITSPPARASAPGGATVALVATVSDDFDADLAPRIQWSSSRDGFLGAGTPRGTTLSVGVHVLTASVTDSDGAASSAQVTYTATPSPPGVTILSPETGKPVFAGAPIVLSAIAIDATDGNISAAIVWSSDVDGPLGSGGTITLATLPLGTRTLTAAVTDSTGIQTKALRTITVRAPNTPPVLSLDAPADGVGVLAGKPLVLAATAVDAEDGDLGGAIKWTSSRDGSLGTGTVLTITKLSVGTHTLTATVTDRDGGTATARVVVSVAQSMLTFPAVADTYVDASAPTKRFGTASGLFASGSPARNALYRFTVRGLGPFPIQQAVLRLTVGTSSSDGSNHGGVIQKISNDTWTEAATIYTNRPALDGTALATRATKVSAKQVIDFDVTQALAGDGNYDFALTSPSNDPVRYQSRETSNGPKLIVTLRQDSTPLVRITAPVSGSKLPGGTPVTFTGKAIDAETGDISKSITWSSSLSGRLGAGASLTVPALAPGTHTISATVTKPGGQSGRAEITLRVRGPNEPPTITITAPADRASAPAGTPVTLSAVPADEWDPDLSGRVTWKSTRDGDLGPGTSRTVVLSEGLHVLTATVTDLDGASTSASVTVTITPTPPVVTIGAPPSGAIVTVGTNLTFTGTALDATDGDLSAALSWVSDRDGPIGTGARVTTATLTPGLHTITASVQDAGGLTGKATRTIAINAPPALTIMPLGDGPPLLTGKPFRLIGIATDPEEGDLGALITWSSDRDGPLGTGTPRSIASLSAGTHVITASVTDRGGATTSATLTLQIAPAIFTFAPVADTYIDAGAATRVFGTAPELLVGSNPVRQALLRFAVTGVVPFAVDTARLRLTVGRNSADASKAGTVVTTLADGTWSEATTTWATRPTVPSSSLVTGPTVGANQVIDFDVSPAVRGDATVNLALTSPSSDWARYLSREAGIGAPQLVVTLRQSTPLVTIFRPAANTTVFSGAPIVLFATAVDPVEGDVAPTLTWTSDRDGTLGQGAVVTPGALSPGVHTITAAAANRRGIEGTAKVTLTVLPDALVFNAIADTYVDQLQPTIPLGASPTLGVVGLPTVKTSFVRFLVTGIGSRPVADARVELTVRELKTAAGVGGTLRRINDNVWSEATTTYARPPSSSGATTLDSIVLPVFQNQVASFRAASQVTKDGTYNFSISSASADAVKYASREGGAPPRLVVTFRAPTVSGPTVAIVTPATTSVSVFDDQPVIFAASASDPKDGNLSNGVVWRSTLDGTLGTGASLTRVLSFGTHVVTATARNKSGSTATTAVTVTVLDRPPALRITTPVAGTVLALGKPVVFTGTATDNRDGNLAARIQWTSDRDGALGTGASITTGPLSPGDHVITATVANQQGTVATVSEEIAIGNASPRLVVTAPADGTTIPEGTRLTLAATARDTEDGDLTPTIEWSSDLQGALGVGGSVPALFSTTGIHHVTASVRDSGGVTRTQTLVVTVTLAPPDLVILSPTEGSSFAGPVTFSARAVDYRDGDRSSSIRWRSSIAGVLGRGATLTVKNLAFGRHVITAEVSDSDGLLATQAIGIAVGNTAPVVTITAPDGGTKVPVWTPLTFTATAVDVLDGDLASRVRWSSSLVGPLGTGASITVPTLPRGTHLVTAVAADAQGLSGQAQVLVTVTGGTATRPPRVTIVAPDAGPPVAAGAAVTFTGSALGDTDDLTPKLTWTSSLDGLLGTGRTFTVTGLSPGLHHVIAAASDPTGNTGTAALDLRVANLPTVFPAVADASTDELQPSTPLGARPLLDLDVQPVERIYLRFVAGGLPPAPVTRAVVRLRTLSPAGASSDTGGEIRTVSGDWDEATLTHLNKPPLDAVALSSIGAVDPGQTVDFDVTTAVTGNGTYNFGIRSSSTNGTQYLARESGSGGPALLVYRDPPPVVRPTVTIVAPSAGTIVPGPKGVTLTATATDPQDGNLGAALVWRSDKDGALGTGVSFTRALSAGAHVITATATDRAGNTGGDVVRVVVVSSSSVPVVTIVTPKTGTSTPFGTPVALAATAFDPSGADLSSTLQWSSSLDGVLGTGPALTRVLRPGSHTITAALPAPPPPKKAVVASVRLDVSTTRVGVEDATFGPTIEGSLDKATATKQQSKLWRQDGIWWACLFVPARSEVRIHRLDIASQTWIDTGVAVDGRGKSRQDVLVDGNHLYVASRFGFIGAPPQNRFLRYTYYPAAQTYALDPGFPVDIPGGGAEALTVAKDSLGRVWITYLLNGTLSVAHSFGSDTQWTAPFTPPVAEGATGAEPDDDSAVIALPNGRLGIFWSNQIRQKFYFAVHTDGGADLDKASWRLEIVSALPSVADDHFNLKLASDGRLFVAVKTSFNTAGRTQVGLFVRAAAGTWSPLYPVVNYEEGPTRPTCLLDEVSRRVYVAYSSFMSDIYYKASNMDAIAFPLSGVGTPLMVSGTNPSGGGLNDPTSTKQNLDPSAGLLVVASTSETNRYWHGWITLPSAAPTVMITAPAADAHVPAGATVLFASAAVSASDGSVDGRVRWVSSRDGQIGTGASFTTTRLSVGVHHISALASDGTKLTGTAAITLTVDPAGAPVVH